MIRNYLKIALRNIARQKLYSGLNVLGLAIGLAGALLIYMFVQHELSYDRFHKDANLVYRIIQRQPGNVFMGSDKFAVTPAALAGELKAAFPEMARATTFSGTPALLSANGRNFYETGLWADEAFFEVFDFSMISGNAETVLSSPGGMLLTESMAERLFGNAGNNEALGEVLSIDYWGDELTFEVTGVVQDPPPNSHLTFEFILPLSANPSYAADLGYKMQNSYLTYFKLLPGGDIAALDEKLPAFVATYLGEEAAKYEYFTQALADIHLTNDVNFDFGIPGDVRLVYLFSIVGVLILLLACVNYMNLAIARSIRRAGEVGLRQAIGAHKLQITAQFLSEALLMTGCALGLALLLVYVGLPLFSELVDRPLVLDWSNAGFLQILAALMILVSLIAGSYPAFYMSRIQPVHALKGGRSRGQNKSALQRFLIVFQYTISISLIAAGFIIYQQIIFIQQKDAGYDRSSIVTIQLQGSDVVNKLDTIREEMRRVPGVIEVASMTHLPINIQSSQRIDSWEGKDVDGSVSIYQANVNESFFDLFGIEMIAGRTFSDLYAGDSTVAIVLNEAAVRALGWAPDTAIGKVFHDRYQVIGVMKDFHLHSLHLPIAPLMLRNSSNWHRYLAVRIKQVDIAATTASLAGVFKSFTPYPVSHQLLSSAYNEMYAADLRLGQTIGYFAFLAILIASMGLFGLAAYGVEQRTKELGVRKVLGASMLGLLALLGREYLLLVGISTVIALPIAYWGSQYWLDGFAYRVEAGPEAFLITTLLIIAVTCLTISYQVVRATSINPVDALRYE